MHGICRAWHASRRRAVRARKRVDVEEPRRDRRAWRGARASSPPPSPAHRPPGGSADCWGSHLALETPVSRGCPSTRQPDGGGARAPSYARARGLSQAKRRPQPVTRPAATGRPLARAQRGAPAVETRPASSRENARQNVQFCAEDMVARRDSGYVSPVRPPPYGRSNGVCNVFRAIRNIDTLFGDTS
ncbi:hypothetical protein ACUXG4_004546 [Cupriavidus metallidurans]